MTCQIDVLCLEASPGQRLAVSGASPALGAWDPSRAVPLTCSSQGLWSGTMPRQDVNAKFKLLIINADTTLSAWEPLKHSRKWPEEAAVDGTRLRTKYGKKRMKVDKGRSGSWLDSLTQLLGCCLAPEQDMRSEMNLGPPQPVPPRTAPGLHRDTNPRNADPDQLATKAAPETSQAMKAAPETSQVASQAVAPKVAPAPPAPPTLAKATPPAPRVLPAAGAALPGQVATEPAGEATPPPVPRPQATAATPSPLPKAGGPAPTSAVEVAKSRVKEVELLPVEIEAPSFEKVEEPKARMIAEPSAEKVEEPKVMIAEPSAEKVTKPEAEKAPGKWFHKPSVGTWLILAKTAPMPASSSSLQVLASAIVRRSLTASVPLVAQAEEVSRQRRTASQWAHMPSVATWASMPVPYKLAEACKSKEDKLNDSADLLGLADPLATKLAESDVF